MEGLLKAEANRQGNNKNTCVRHKERFTETYVAAVCWRKESIAYIANKRFAVARQPFHTSHDQDQIAHQETWAHRTSSRGAMSRMLSGTNITPTKQVH